MPPKGSKRGPDGKWYIPSPSSQHPAEQQSPSPSKKRPVSDGETPERAQDKRPKPCAKAAASGKASKADAALVNVLQIRKDLNAYVKDMAKTVDGDWHDSYEETDEMLHEWLEDCAARAEAVLEVGVVKGLAFEKCHEVLKIIVDTWTNIQAIPFRGCPKDSLSQGEKVRFKLLRDSEQEEKRLKITCVSALVKYVWPLLLARSSGSTAMPDATLLQMIKDAKDHGVAEVHQPSSHEKVPPSLEKDVEGGRTRLSALVGRTEDWEHLPSTRKVHRMRRCIDRRFDGPRDRRTRDPAMFEEDAGCSLM
eukprot:TRINITY_DN75192_c0_g1_i1.p1 TRINITY_DN75192_c0_g1~~TRINITY_DN75192_c0_g1_i1.p1  ORF type:complete len:307 (+),score=64.00 TRINITY_DN75192_c0_g1_i1:86-1006(+)